MATQHRKARASATKKIRGRPKVRRKEMARKKISTTIAPESYTFLQNLIGSGKAESIAQAVDLVLDEARRIDNRVRLDRMTAEGYENMSPEAMAENKELEQALAQSVGEMHLDD